MMSPRERSSDYIAPMAAVLHQRLSFHQCWILLLLMVMLLAHLQKSHAVTLIVGDNDLTLSEAMEIAEAGDIVELQEGTYEECLESVRDGEIENPITIIGNENTIIKATESRAVRINHSHINLVGFTVDGFFGSSHDEDSYINKCVWIDGEVDDDVTPLQGFVMRDMLIQNCGSECLRLKNFVTGAIITNNNIRNCGLYDYQLDDDEKNGEGIYIGTSINQWTYGVDECNYNYVSDNTIETNANECVDIKEGSTGNVVEHNICSNQLDEDSGCYSSRGDANTFRFNFATACTGVGFRLGGKDGYGHSNNIYGNKIVNAEFGSLKIMADGQGLICENICEQGECEVRGSETTNIILASCCEVCDTIELDIAMEASPDLATVSNNGN